jgi:hypothetical protein
LANSALTRVSVIVPAEPALSITFDVGCAAFVILGGRIGRVADLDLGATSFRFNDIFLVFAK